MGTYKRPLADGEICQDSRVAFNPFLGLGKDGDQEVKPLGKATAEPAVAALKTPKKAKASDEPVVEAPVETVVETVEPEAEAAE